jgi:hypothetical protein
VKHRRRGPHYHPQVRPFPYLYNGLYVDQRPHWLDEPWMHVVAIFAMLGFIAFAVIALTGRFP